jgi:hypothetical protein
MVLPRQSKNQSLAGGSRLEGKKITPKAPEGLKKAGRSQDHNRREDDS